MKCDKHNELYDMIKLFLNGRWGQTGHDEFDKLSSRLLVSPAQ